MGRVPFAGLEKIKTIMVGNVVFDGRNIYTPSEVSEEGFSYYGIGVQPTKI